MEETVFLDENGVLITRSRVVVPNQTFAMSGVTSVKVAKTSSGLALLFGVACLLFALFMFIGAANSPDPSAGVVVGIFAGAIGGLLIYAARPKYALVLLSASGETKAFVSEKEDFVTKISIAVTDAMVARG